MARPAAVKRLRNVIILVFMILFKTQFELLYSKQKMIWIETFWKLLLSYFLFQIIFCNKNGNKNMTIIYVAYTCKYSIKTHAYDVQFQRCYTL